ncbi:hypothetical protein CLUG_01805 [Clavispora lusitaniae ATCC 42720]|uniref:Zn(2)-C6 fungal-type domain-containing protein n=2 Tax=Clavispora lusitaniae TaxID=36911 RepID=C4Y0S3_CLAL4|nr:uncharacterized protein CLUG_01805 [Clavispora lusitaniae ATCC 42720]EEQ37682.1 hypothetical protein CLUG_01805 [Clavispora lusitaniae ATCC 42720]KAF5211979.1 Fungal specific transcription factor [Clavispora lusitaniae]
MSHDNKRAAASRTIAACQRCRAKKVRCDQALPSCSRCLKAGHECIGIDPASGREVPRSYVQHLESRVAELEAQLAQKKMNPSPAPEGSRTASAPSAPFARATPFADTPRYFGPASGVSFARLMTAALRLNPPPPPRVEEASTVTAAVLPPKPTAQEFIRIYFAQSNSQVPVLERERFLQSVFAPIYGPWDPRVPLAPDDAGERAGGVPERETWLFQYTQFVGQRLDEDAFAAEAARIDVPSQFRRPLFFLFMVLAIASSANHLQYPTTISAQFRAAALQFEVPAQDPLEHLEAVLLMAVYATMRPCVPGVWYVLGTALRLCVDLGLHTGESSGQNVPSGFAPPDASNFARRASGTCPADVLNRRRRLFWCTYSLDRQICFYLGRPVGIPEEAISTQYPSVEDAAGQVAHAMFRMRRIQSEVQRVLYDNGEIPRRFENLDEWRRHITTELFSWRAQTPSQAAAACEFNAEYFALNFHHTLLSLNALSPRNFRLSEEAYHTVSAASQNVMTCYAQLHARKAINYTWAAVYNLFNAGTSYLFAIYTCETVRQSMTRAAVARTAQSCAAVLASLAPSCAAGQSCCDTFQVLTAAVLRLCYGDESKASLPEDSPSGSEHSIRNRPASPEGKVPTGEVPGNNTKSSQNANSEQWNEKNNDSDTQKEDRKAEIKMEEKAGIKMEEKSEINPTSETYSNDPRRQEAPETQDTSNSGLKKEEPSPGRVRGVNESFGVPVISQTPISRHSSFSSPTMDGLLWNNAPDLNSFFKEVENVTPSAVDMGSSLSLESELPREGRRVFELIQLPIESIWDQFFTSSKTGLEEEIAG